MLRRDGFGPNPLFHCLIIEELSQDSKASEGHGPENSSPSGLRGVPIGFALYFWSFSTWQGNLKVSLLF